MLQCLRFLAVLGTVLAVLALCTGCQYREINLAIQGSDQAQEAAQRVVVERVAPQLAGLTPDVQATIKESMDQIVHLLTASRLALRPALALTAGDEPMPKSETSVDDAMDRHRSFISQLGIQTGKAEAEAERAGWFLAIGSMVLKLGQAAADNWLTILLGGGGGAGLLIAGGLKYVGRLKTAVRDSVMFGNEAIETNPQDVVQRNILIERHREIQKTNGTQALIRAAGAAVKSRG